jgi:hypothetical protein
MGKKMWVSGFYRAVHAVEQIVDVGDAQLAGEARVDAAALGAALVQLLIGVVREDRLAVKGHARGP